MRVQLSVFAMGPDTSVAGEPALEVGVDLAANNEQSANGTSISLPHRIETGEEEQSGPGGRRAERGAAGCVSS